MDGPGWNRKGFITDRLAAPATRPGCDLVGRLPAMATPARYHPTAGHKADLGETAVSAEQWIPVSRPLV